MALDPDLKLLGELLRCGASSDYEGHRSRLGLARQTFDGLLARRFAASVNDRLRTRPHETFADIQVLTEEVNADLRSLGLGIKCPQTGLPVYLGAKARPGTTQGQFTLVRADIAGDPVAVCTRKVPVVELVEATPISADPKYWARRLKRLSQSPERACKSPTSSSRG